MTDLQQQIVDYLNDAPAVTHRGLVHFTREPAATIAEAVDGLVLDGVVVVRDGRIRLRPVAVEVVDEPAPEPLPAPQLPVEPPPPPVPPEEPPAPSATAEIEAVRLSMRLRVLDIVARSPWLSSHQIAKLVGARWTKGAVSGALNTLWNQKAITRVGAPARVAGGGYRYALPGAPVPADLAVAELPAKAPQVVVAGSNRHQTLELLAEHPWRSLGQIREALGGVKGVSAILATMHGDGSVVRIKTADGYRYALPGTPELIGAAELLTAPPPIVPEVGVWVDREPPALPGVLEMDRLRAEVERLQGERRDCLIAMGFIHGEGDVLGATKATVENMVGTNKRHTALLQRYRDLREKLHDAFKLPNGIEDDALLRQARWLEGRASAHLQPEPLVTLRLVVEDVGGDHPGATLLASAPEHQPTGATLQNLTREQAQALGPHLYADVLLQIVPAPASAPLTGSTAGAGAGASEVPHV